MARVGHKGESVNDGGSADGVFGFFLFLGLVVLGLYYSYGKYRGIDGIWRWRLVENAPFCEMRLKEAESKVSGVWLCTPTSAGGAIEGTVVAGGVELTLSGEKETKPLRLVGTAAEELGHITQLHLQLANAQGKIEACRAGDEPKR